MKLYSLFPDLPSAASLSYEPEITSLVWDSRKAEPGCLFFCLSGALADGHAFARAAYDRGCRIFVAEHPISLPQDALCIIRPNTRIALAEVSAAFYGYPARSMTLIGITGTKGKTSVAHFIGGILTRCGIPTAVIGTTGLTYGTYHRSTANTTPESAVLQQMFAEAAAHGITHVVMEVSSQAYKLHRVHGLEFDAAIFTNLSPDHIGPQEHADFTEYRECKAQLFAHTRCAILNADDPFSPAMAASCHGEILTYGIAPGCRPSDEGTLLTEVLIGTDGYPLTSDSPVCLPPPTFPASDIQRIRQNGYPGVAFQSGGTHFTLRMPGAFAVSNGLAAITLCRHLGLHDPEISEALADISVPGRFEPLPAPPNCAFFLDYAHNGLSLRSTLSVLRAYHPDRLVCLIGSVGGRSQMRRSELGSIAGALADFCIFTADNPDFEDPAAICEEMANAAGDCPHICIPDRREAIFYAVEHARPGDIVLFAGKGHETYQLIRGVKEPFSERDILNEALSALAKPL